MKRYESVAGCIDATNAEDLTKAEVIGRQQVLEIYNFLKKYIPGIYSK